MNGPQAVLVTGAGKRIGRALSLALAARGIAVIGHTRSSPSAVRSLGREVERLGARFFLLEWDLAKDPERLIDRCLRFPVTLGGVINNASVFEKGDLLALDMKVIRRILDINAFSPLSLARAFYRKAGRGFVINLLDAGAGPYNRNFQVYRLSKRLLGALTLECAALFAPRVRVNGIAPGAVLPSRFDSAQKAAAKARSAPMGAGGSVEEVVAAMEYLLDHPSVTGQVLYADGGIHLK
jgi:pteridine reductase